MVKVGSNRYLCPWCGTKIKHNKKSVPGGTNKYTHLPGRHTVTSALVCPNCGRDVSQRTREGLR